MNTRSRTSRARARTPAAGKAGEPATLQLRIEGGDTFRIALGGPLPRLALAWGYRVRNRARWRGDPAASRDVEKTAIEDLGSLKVPPAALEQLARTDLVEVSVPFLTEAEGWEARILPWEALLTAAARERRQGNPLLVVRHLVRAGGGSGLDSAGPSMDRALIVVSEPGRLQGVYTFDSERRLIEGHLQAKGPEVLRSPTAAQLRAKLEELEPAVVHLTGFDAHQGGSLLGLDPGSVSRDGIFLGGAAGEPQLCEAEALGQILTAAARKPRIVTCNAYNTASRVAAHVVAAGAEAAIGFQDEVDDSVAERFFASFYRGWRLSGADVLQAFRLAWQEAIGAAELRGSGIVLWSARSLLGGGVSERLRDQAGQERVQAIQVAGAGTDLRDILEVDVKPLDALNYGLLHNGASLFERLLFRKLRPGVLRDVGLSVSLSVGAEEFRYRESLDLELPLTDVTDRVRLPLAWEYIRSMRENTQTGLFVEITVGERSILRRTFPAILLPVEEWRDTRRDGKWLPSFVLPRDPAVASVIERAQRYVMALRDDPGAGFDGYQSVDEGAPDPSEAVDLQVQAVWATLLHDCNLSYINPPPTYTASSQRLRSPHDVLEGRRGTCIDLALLMAACLEYVDIYPVLFLLKGHAFPGYWRSEAAHRDFVAMERYSERSADSPRRGQRDPWVISSSAYDEIVDLVRGNRLVPLETVWLTRHQGFGEATEAGIENLGDRASFEAMLDVVKARECGVTPLPLRGGLR